MDLIAKLNRLYSDLQEIREKRNLDLSDKDLIYFSDKEKETLQRIKRIGTEFIISKVRVKFNDKLVKNLYFTGVNKEEAKYLTRLKYYHAQENVKIIDVSIIIPGTPTVS